MNLEKIFTRKLVESNRPDDFFQRELAVDERGQYLPVKKNHDMEESGKAVVQKSQPDFTPLYKYYELILKGGIIHDNN